MSPHHAFCDPAEIVHVEREMAQNPRNMGVGVIDMRMRQVRLFPFDETNAFRALPVF